MSKRMQRIASGAFIAGVAAAGLAGFEALTPEAEGLIRPAWPPFACPDVWAPVICDNGQVYSNLCYANLFGATGCVPFGLD